MSAYSHNDNRNSSVFRDCFPPKAHGNKRHFRKEDITGKRKEKIREMVLGKEEIRKDTERN
jgi:hypothetical protein